MTSKSIEEQLASIKSVLGRGSDIPDFRFTYGKYKNKSLEFVFDTDKAYLMWLYNEDVKLPSVVENFIVDKIIRPARRREEQALKTIH